MDLSYATATRWNLCVIINGTILLMFVKAKDIILGKKFCMCWISLVAQMVENLPAMWETKVQSLGQEDPLERGLATYSSILAWRITWREESGRLQSTGSQRVGHH